MAHISNEKDLRNKTEKKQATGKKVFNKVDENRIKKKEVKESEEKKSKEKECPVDGQWLKDLGMLDLRSLDEFWWQKLVEAQSYYFNLVISQIFQDRFFLFNYTIIDYSGKNK